MSRKVRIREHGLTIIVTIVFFIGFIFFILIFLLSSLWKIYLFGLTPVKLFPIFIIYSVIGTIFYLIAITVLTPMEVEVKPPEPLKPVEVIREVPEQFIEVYEVNPPYVYVGIAKKRDRLQYYVIEPILTDSEKEFRKKIEDVLYQELAIEEVTLLDKREAEQYLREKIYEIIKKFRWKISRESIEKIVYYITRDHIYYGKIDPLMRDENVEDISCNSPNVPVYVFHRFYESLPTNISFTEEELDRFIIRLAYASGRYVSIDTPIVDATLPDGTRIHLNYGKEVSRKGSSFTIRKFRKEPFTIIDLIKLETIDEQIAAFLWLVIEYNASILVAGGTASGKTTFLNAISLFIRPDKKIVSIEDTAELNLPHENWNPLVERTGFGVRGGQAEIRMFELLKAALRQRPDVIIVGEVRGEEAYTMFQGMASVAGDTPILIRDDDGVKLIPIGELVDKYYLPGEEWTKKYVNNIDVLSLDKDGVVKFRPILYVMRHRADEIYKIRYVGGGEIRATGSHSVVVISDTGEISLKRVDELKKGDFLVTFVGADIEDGDIILDLKDILKDECVVKKMVLQKEFGGVDTVEVVLPASGRGKYINRYINVDKDFAFLLGVYMADGCVKDYKGKRICIIVGDSEREILNKVQNIMKEKFDITPTIDDRGSHIIAEFNHTLLATLFEKLVGSSNKSMHIPEFLWKAKKEVVKAFLDGYKCDARKTTTRYYISYTSSNKRLINEIMWLAKVKGFGGFISEKSSPHPSVNIYLDRLSRKSSQAQRIPITPIRKLYEVLRPKNLPWKYTFIFREGRKTVTKSKAMELIEYIIKNRTKEISKEAETIINNIKLLISSTLGVAEVLNVEKISFNGYVYDVSVPNAELFIGGENPIVLHNTGHGGLGSIHAESVKAVIDRLTSEPMNIPVALIPTLNLIVLITRLRIGDRIIRKVIHIAEPYIDEKTGELKFNDVFIWDAYKRKYIYTGKSRTLERISRLTGIPLDKLNEEISKRKTIIEWMIKKNIRRFRDVTEIIRRFYMNPEEVYQLARLELLRMEAA